MDESSEIAEFLRESAASGSVVGPGEFTISHQEAWKRLKHALPRQEFWVLKLLQAAVRWKASSFAVDHRDDAICIHFSPSSEADEVTAENLLGAEFKGTALQHLRVALAGACADPQFVSVEWSWNSYSIAWSEDEVVVREEPGDSEAPARVTVRHKGSNWFRSTFGTAPFSEEEAALRERAYACPIPILLEGKELEFEPPLETELLKTVHLGRSEPGGPVQRVDYYFHRHLQLAYYFDWMVQQKVRRRRRPYGCHPAGSTAETVVWVLDGVVVDHSMIDEIESAVCSRTLLSADGLTLDLSGFAVKGDEEAERRIAASRAPRTALLRELLESDLSSLLRHQEARQKVNRSVFGRHLLLGLIFWFYLMPGLVELFRLPKITTTALQEDLTMCRTHIARRLRDYDSARIA